MKIGIDCRLWSQKGVGRYIRNLVINLQKIDKKNDYTLFIRKEDKNNLKIENPNFKFIEANIPWHSLEEQILFPKILKNENLDLIHFTYSSLPVFYNRPFVLTIHDLTPFHFTTGRASTKPLIYKFKKLGYKFVISKAAQNAKKIIVPSDFTKKEVMEHLNIKSEKIRVIYEGADQNIQDTRERIIKEEYLLYVGNAYPHKNLERLIAAFSQIGNHYLKLVLVGQEDFFYKRLKKESKSSNVIFYGIADEEELISLYRNATVYVIPSLMEGFGLTGLEAMANKCLVLASDIPVHREIYRNAAIYFNPQDSTELKELIDKVYSNLEIYREKKIALGLKRSKEFSWDKMARETLKIYEGSVSL